MPRSAAPSSASSGSSSLSLEDVPRIEAVGIAPPLLDAGDREPRRPRRERRRAARDAARACSRSAGRSPRPRRRSCAGRAGCSPAAGAELGIVAEQAHRAAPASATARWARRLRARRGSAARVRRASAATKSCADRPMRRSGCGRPSAPRIGRLSHGPVSTAGGQLPSLRPPSTRRSARCRRASSGPQIDEARMAAEARPDGLGRQHRGEQRRPFAAGDRRAGPSRRCAGAPARRPAPRRPRPPQRVGRGEHLGGGDGGVEQRVGRGAVAHQHGELAVAASSRSIRSRTASRVGIVVRTCRRRCGRGSPRGRRRA